MKVKLKSLSRVQLLASPWTAAYQASPSMGFSRQEYWSGVPLPFPPRKPLYPTPNNIDIQTHFGQGNGTPLQYSCLENLMDGEAWWAAVHGVAKSWTRLSDFTFSFHFHALEKEMATHASVLAWRIPGTGKPGGLPSMGLHRVGHD